MNKLPPDQHVSRSHEGSLARRQLVERTDNTRHGCRGMELVAGGSTADLLHPTVWPEVPWSVVNQEQLLF